MHDLMRCMKLIGTDPLNSLPMQRVPKTSTFWAAYYDPRNIYGLILLSIVNNYH